MMKPVNEYRLHTYDPLNRLVAATQRYGNGNVIATDTLTMAYDDLWRVTSKSQRLSQTGLMFPGTLSTGYDMSYHYNPSWGRHFQMSDVTETHYRKEGIPTATDNVLSTHRYTYDPNGNLSYETVDRKRVDRNTTADISERHLLWDCQNRLRGISDNGYVSLYWYDAEGNRTVKEHLGGEAIWVNAVAADLSTDTVTYSIYPNPYITINGNRWTKHYYIGSERVASRTGTIMGGFNGLHDMDSDVAGSTLQIPVNYDSMCVTEEDSIASMYERFGVPYEVQHANSRGQVAHMYFPITRTDSEDNTAETSGEDSQRSHPDTLGEGPVYFYHRDHLGSTMSVTDSLGNTVQQVEYTPWGEVFVEQRSGNSDFSTPYLFNGKELDEETGLYYYGARYYDPKMSMWYSVDRYAEKYPFISSYIYGCNNPLLFSDINGDTIRAVSKISGQRLLNEIHNTFYGKRFDKLNSLFQLSDDGITMKGIKRNDFSAAISELNSDEKALAIGYYNAINSKGIHYVDMTMRNEQLNKKTKVVFASNFWKYGADVDTYAGGGINIEYLGNGSFTIVIMNSTYGVDYVYASNGVHYKRRPTPAEILAHEVLGHGYSGSVGSPNSNTTDAIQITNLYWRVRGYHNFYRDGKDHKEIMSKSKANNIPYFLINYK